MAFAALGLVVAALPVFLVGGLAVQLRAELAFSETGLGAAITAFFVAAGLGSVPGGKLSDRLGPRRSLRAGSLVTATALLMLAVAQTWGGLVAGLAVAGLALGLTEPGIALLVASVVHADRQGLAFGIKEAAIPGATLLAGASVPVIALTVGWRWAFAAGVLLVPVLWALIPRAAAGRGPRSPQPVSATGAAAAAGVGEGEVARAGDGEAAAGGGEDEVARAGDGEASAAAAPGAGEGGAAVGPLAVVALGAGLGVAAVTAMTTFFVEAAVAAGLRPGRAGLLLSAGSVAGITGRVGVGWLADRWPRPQLPVVAVMLVAGAGALGLLAMAGAARTPYTGGLLIVGALVAFGVGWGWTGLLFLSAVRASPEAPGGAAGIALAGLSVGGALGPLLFGVLASAASFAAAWAAGGAAMLAGAVLVLAGDRLLARRAPARLPARSREQPAR